MRRGFQFADFEKGVEFKEYVVPAGSAYIRPHPGPLQVNLHMTIVYCCISLFVWVAGVQMVDGGMGCAPYL